MKLFVVFLVIFLAGCSDQTEIATMRVDGACETVDINLFTDGDPITIEEFDKRINQMFHGNLSDFMKKEVESARVEYKKGGKIYRVTSDSKSWSGLYGSSGYGVIRENCLVAYLQLVVS